MADIYFFAKQDRRLQQLKEKKVEIYLVKLIYMYIGPYNYTLDILM